MAKASATTGSTTDVIHTRTTAGSEESQVVVMGEDGTDNVLGPLGLVGSTRALPTVGASYTSTTGTITTSTSTVTSGDIALAGNITIAVFGTYAGVTFVFEVSPDAGTNWFPAAAVREDNGSAELGLTAGASVTRLWTMAAPGFNRIRVRATAWTSGTANIIILPGTYAFETQVAAVAARPPGAVPVTVYLDSTTGISTEALATSLVVHRGDAAAVTGATTYAPTAGKTFRLITMVASAESSGTAMVGVKVRLRSLTSGTTVLASPVRLHAQLRFPTATAAAGTGTTPFLIAAGDAGLLDVPTGGSLGISHVAGATSYTLNVSLVGYEF